MSKPRGLGMVSLDQSISRRLLIGRLTALGIGLPAVAALLAACGSEDAEPTTTAAVGAATVTESVAEPTPTAAVGEATATEAMEATPTGAASGANPRLMGMTIEPPQNTGGTVIRAYNVDFLYLHYTIESYGIHETLIELNPETVEPVANLASAWEASEDARTWTFEIRDGVSWHDGSALTAEDAVATLVAHGMPGMGYIYIAERLGEITADGMTVTCQLAAPFADVATDLYWIPIFKAEILSELTMDEGSWDGHPSATGADPTKVIGTGPFKFDEYVTGDFLRVVRFDDYWDGSPILDAVIFQQVEDDAVVGLLSTDAVDFDASVPIGSVGDLESAGLVISDYPSPTQQFFMFNLDPEKTTLFQGVEVRQAIAHAIDRQTLVDSILFGYGTVLPGTYPSFSWANDPAGITAQYDYDPDKAMTLLDEAGWLAGTDGIRERDGERLSFSVLARSSNETYAVAIQEYLRVVGVEAIVESVQEAEWAERYSDNRDFDVALSDVYWGADVDQTWQWACSSYPDGGNKGGYCNEVVDQLLVEATETLDREARIEIINELQNTVLTDMPTLILYEPRQVGARNPRVHNVFLNVFTTQFNMETWWVDA